MKNVIDARGCLSSEVYVELLSTPKSYSVCRCVRTYKLPQVMRGDSDKYVLVSRRWRRGWRVGRRAAGSRDGLPRRTQLHTRRPAASHAHHGPLDRRQLQPVRRAALRLPGVPARLHLHLRP